MTKLPTVTIATVALNEEQNIGKFLRSALQQKEEGFKIMKVLVISDGSSDKTVEIAKSFKSKLIEVVAHNKRTGKSARLNELYQSLDTDLLLQCDSDIIYSHEYVIRDMLMPLIKNQDIAMCGGNPLPIKAVTYIEKAINHTTEVYQEFRRKVRNGDNVFSADGRLLSYKKELVKKITVPVDMIANDMFTYFCCLSLGYKYRFVPNAVVLFRSPQSLRDHIRQNVRFRASPFRMGKYFSKELVRRETSIPKFLLHSTQLQMFLRHPISTLYIYIVNFYCKLRARMTENKLTAKWAIADSTKHV